MPMLLIAGSYKITQTAPDGDSVRFYPTDVERFKQLEALDRGGARVRVNRSGGAQLRLEAIDALETHYQPQEGNLRTQHQPLPFAHAAADALLKHLGFTEVKRNASETVTAATPEQVPGFILSRFSDKNGRPVSFVFKGDAPKPDGSSLFLDSDLLKQSANYFLLSEGLVYPTFYSKLFVDLRQELTRAAQQARADRKNLWNVDRTTAGFELDSLKTITDEAAILPKLFRRLVDYLSINDGSVDLAGFPQNLAARGDRLLLLPEGRFTGLDNLLEVTGQTLKLTRPIEELVFQEK